MKTFAKTQMASFMASGIDYCCTILCVELLHLWPVWASALGTMAGGYTNFSIGRNWVFQQGNEALRRQLMRYLLVWLGYLFLMTSAVFLLTHFTDTNYVVAKIGVSVILAVSYNYPLQKKFVFR